MRVGMARRVQFSHFLAQGRRELVERALAQNLDVRMSLARVDAARALSRGARAAGRPEIDVGGDAGRRRTSAYGIGFTTPYQADQFDANLSASWELYLFGIIRKGVDAANADLAASQ
jgi:outer membrane protein TolC